ncbi:MAG: tetratricopeptide repeat protein, partial [Planctomycetes bacterium]|nr:tetratricopeptide repeat protein [Planctomycetota bacterium]
LVPAEKTYEPHAAALVEEVIRDGRSRLAAKALRLKADLMARSKKYPAVDVINAYRAAATTGPRHNRRDAAEAMRAFAEGAKEHDAVLEAYKLLCRNNRGNVGGYIQQARQYLRKHDLKDRTEPVMRELLEFARRDSNYAYAWRSLGECFMPDDPQKAVEIWAEGIAKSGEAYRSRNGRNDLIQRICRAMLRERNKEKISRDFVAKVLLDEMDVHLGDTRLADHRWPGYFWEAVGNLDLTDKMTAKMNAVPEGRRDLGNTYRTIGDAYRSHLHQPDTALKYYAMALESSAFSDRNHVLAQIISIHKEKKNWQKALDTVHTVMKSNRNSHHYKMQEGYFLAKLGQRAEALESYEKASQLAGRGRYDYSNHRSISESAFEAGLYDLALEKSTLALRMHDYYRRAQNRGADSGHVRTCFLNIAKCHEKKGENEKAIDALLTGASRIGEEHRRRELYDELKRIVRDGGQLDKLIADYERNAKETQTEKPALRMIFGDVARDKNDHDQALRHYRAALEVAPNNADIRKRVVETLRNANRTDELIAHYRDWTRYDSKNVQHYSEMGRLLKNAGRNAEAMRAYTTMLEAMPTEADSHRRMANIYTNTNRHGDAIGMWKRVVKFRPEEPQSHYGLAQSYTRNNQRDLAVGVYEKMLETTWDQRFGNVHREAKRRLARAQAQ